MQCHRIEELLELLEAAWLAEQDLSLVQFVGKIAQEAGFAGPLTELSDDMLIYQLKMRDKDQQEKFPKIPFQTQFIRSLNEGDGTDKGGPDSLGLDSFTNELKEGIDWHEEEPFKLPPSDVAAAEHPEIVKENQVNGPSDRCNAIDKEHLPVVKAGNFLDISKENVEENQINNLLHQGGEEADKEVDPERHLGHHEDLDIIEIEADVFFHFNLQKW